MDIEFEYIKIPTFEGINDTPVEPTASKAGNGSHVIAQFNELVDQCQYALQQLNNRSQNWKRLTLDNTTDQTYQASFNEKLLIDVGVSEFYINLPTGWLPPQGEVSVLNIQNGVTIYIQNYDRLNGIPNYSQVYFSTTHSPITFVWMGNAFLRWQAIDPNQILTKVISTND